MCGSFSTVPGNLKSANKGSHYFNYGTQGLCGLLSSLVISSTERLCLCLKSPEKHTQMVHPRRCYVIWILGFSNDLLEYSMAWQKRLSWLTLRISAAFVTSLEMEGGHLTDGAEADM